MIYDFTQKKVQKSFDSIDREHYTAAFVSASEFEEFYKSFGFNEKAFANFSREEKHFRSKIEVHENYSYGTLKIIEPSIEDKTESRIAFYLSVKTILIIGISDTGHINRDRFNETAERCTDDEFVPAKFFSSFVNTLISSDNKELEELEISINSMEDRIIKEKEFKNFNEELLEYKIKLLNLRNYYEQFIDIGEALKENENKIFDKNTLHCFNSLIRRSERLCSNINLLRESVIQLRETYQSSLDMRLNNTMKLFTVLTAVFSPLTLIAGWYGMNFSFMPELKWRYGYVYVIVLSVAVLTVCLIIFKKKKLI